MKKVVTKEGGLTFGGRNISVFLLMFVFVLFSWTSFAQKLINGKVTGNEGETLCGVNVVEKGTYNGTATDSNGNYFIRVGSTDASLVFSIYGMKTEEIPVANQSIINCTLKKLNNPYKTGDAEIANLKLLNLWGERPDAVNILYKKAFEVFASKPLEATYSDLANDKDVQQLCKKDHITHWGGPMLGQIGPHGASVWMRTLRPAKVEVLVSVNGKEKKFGPVQSTAETDLTAIVPVTGLKPGSSNAYKVLIDGQPIPVADNTVINTPLEESTPAQTRIVFGSDFHRWGLGNQKQVDAIKSRKPVAMLLGGDIAVQDKYNKVGLHRADFLLRDFYPAWKSLVAEVPVYVTWDDHDYFGNDLAGIPKGFTENDKEAVWQVFRYAWNNPSYGLGEKGKGNFFRTRIGPADIIMLDDRYFRTGEKGSFLGDEQMKWLKKQLLDCKGPFIILSCGTMWSDYVSNGKDSWGANDPKGREQIFKLIEDNNIGGVLLISGDRHGARGFRIPRPSGFNFYEFEVGSLGGRTGPAAHKDEWKTQFYGINGKYAFGEFTFDTTRPDSEVTFRLIGDDKKIIYEMKLTRSELTPKK